MKFLIKKVIFRKASNIYLTFILQFIICYIRVCMTTDEFDDVLTGEEIGSVKFRPNLIFGHKNKNNHTLKAEPHILEAILKLTIRPGMVKFSSQKPHSLPQPKHVKRSKRKSGKYNNFFTEMVQDVCPSVSDWVARPEALDPYGNKLTVVQRIPVNGTVINQYFYETFCSYNLDYYDVGYSQNQQNFIENSQCRGVDKTMWNSRCRENYIWTYGKVMTNSGDTGWSVIAIRGSCGCAIWPRSNDFSGVGRGRRVITKQKSREDNHIINDPFF